MISSKYEVPEIVPTGKWTRFLTGPFEYIHFEEKRVVGSYLMAVEASGGVKSSVTYNLSDYQVIESDLKEKISLDTFELSDHQKVSCIGQTDLQFELLDNTIVLVGDSNAVANARKARFRKSSGGWFNYYAVAGLVLFVSTIVFVWHRNKGQ